MNKHLATIFFIFLFIPLSNAQRKWVGGHGNAWDNPLNWEPAGLPVMTDDIILDNSKEGGDYVVMLPVTSVTLTSIAIHPAPTRSIKLVLPATNVTSPALTLTSTADAVVLWKGAIFQNASGLTSGQSLRIAGKLRINNGGAYIHNTRSAHANDVVARLSTEEGTEEGLFEFDIPAASSTISLSNRVFGKLRLSALTYNAPVSYSGGGSNPVVIRSDLELGDRVSFSIGFASTFSIKRNLVQAGGIFNISNDNNPTVLLIGGDILQSSGVITETGIAEPVVWFNGREKQRLQYAGGITNQVIVRVDNSAGLELLTPLTLTHKLELRRGIIQSAGNALLTLSAACKLEADSTSKSFVYGRLKRQGLVRAMHVLFPIGDATTQRWVALKEATGDFTISYQPGNPNHISEIVREGIDHISSIESWTIEAGGENTEARIELSFDNMHSGGVTDLQTLRVAQLEADRRWGSRGNSATTGSAGAAGSVISELVTAFEGDMKLFTLASSVSNENTLPQQEILFTGRKEGSGIRFEWKSVADLTVTGFVVESASGNFQFAQVKKIPGQPSQTRFSFFYLPRHQAENYFRIRVMLGDGSSFLSRVLYIKVNDDDDISTKLLVENDMLTLSWLVLKPQVVQIYVYDMTGRILTSRKEKLTAGINNILFRALTLSKGMYVVSVVSADGRRLMKFIKP